MRLTARAPPLAAFVALFAVLVSGERAAAQTIGGTLRESGTGLPIAGAFAILLDASGSAVDATFTSPAGTFVLAAMAVGQHRVRVERIGYETWTSPTYVLAAGQRSTVSVEVAPRPVSLAAISVQVVRSCLDDSSQGAELAAVWEEARKALETARWAEEQDISFTIREFERVLEPASLAIRGATTRTRRRVRLPPFKSLALEQLTSSGYVEIRGDTATYYAPDATVLLSQEFRDTHCFGLRRAEVGEVSMIGVTFTPRASRTVPEVEGTLWLDETSGELRRLELLYRNVPLPRGANRRLVGADLTFDRLPNGPFYVRDWWIRYPVGGRDPFRPRGALAGEGPRTVLVAYKQTGGSVTHAFVGGQPAFDAMGGVVSGVVHDSSSGGPLVGAEIILRDWDAAAAFFPYQPGDLAPLSGITDASGEFTIAKVPDGDYAVRVEHPRLRTMDVRLSERRVVVKRADSPRVTLTVPSSETLYRRLCPSGRLDKMRGAVVGVARDAITSLAATGVRVEALWRVNRITVAGASPVLTTSSKGVVDVTDEQGRFLLCDVPLGETVFLRREEAPTGVSLTLDGRITWQDVPIEP